MKNIYLSKMYVYFSEMFLLKCNKNVVFFFKITQNREKEEK